MPTNTLGQWIPDGSQSFAAALADIYRHLGVFIRASTGDDFRQKVTAAVRAGLMTVSAAEPALGFVGGRLVTFDGTTLRINSARQMLSGTAPGTKTITNGGNAQYEISFPQKFVAVPRVFVQNDLSARVTVAVHSVTTEGFQVSVDNRSGVQVTAGSYRISWLAIE